MDKQFKTKKLFQKSHHFQPEKLDSRGNLTVAVEMF